MRKAGLTIDDIGLIEINEAFAVQVLAFTDHFGLADDDDRVNQYGGAIAMGHPLASSGVRLMTQLARQFAERPDVRYGLTTMCVGLGMGGTVIWENPHSHRDDHCRSTATDPREHRVTTTEKHPPGNRRSDQSAPAEVVTQALPALDRGARRPRRAGGAVTVALITLDNGRDHTRPNTFGPAGLASLDAAISAAIDADPDAIAVTGKPFVFAAGADLSQSATVADRSVAADFVALGHRVFAPAREAPDADLRLRQRARPRRRHGAGAALRLPDARRRTPRMSPNPRCSSASCPAGAAPSCSRGSPARTTPSPSSSRTR